MQIKMLVVLVHYSERSKTKYCVSALVLNLNTISLLSDPSFIFVSGSGFSSHYIASNG